MESEVQILQYPISANYSERLESTLHSRTLFIQDAF